MVAQGSSRASGGRKGTAPGSIDYHKERGRKPDEEARVQSIGLKGTPRGVFFVKAASTEDRGTEGVSGTGGGAAVKSKGTVLADKRGARVFLCLPKSKVTSYGGGPDLGRPEVFRKRGGQMEGRRGKETY